MWQKQTEPTDPVLFAFISAKDLGRPYLSREAKTMDDLPFWIVELTKIIQEAEREKEEVFEATEQASKQTPQPKTPIPVEMEVTVT